MAYAAVISVLKTLVELQHPFPFQEIDYPGSQVRDLQENLIFLKDFLETISPKARYLEDLIRVAMYDAEDALDSNLLNFIPNSESSGWAEDNYMRSFSRALEKVNNTVGSIAKEAKEISPNVKRPLPLLMPPTPEVSRRNLIVGREDDLTNLKSRLTGGSDKLAAEVAENGGDFMKILPLDGEESWALLQSEVFRYKACPEELVTTAKRVSTNCKGIPLAIVTIGGVLMEAGPKDWAIAASSLNDCGDCDELIDAVLSLSFKSLRQYAKACLLYMGIFPNNYDIPLSKLLKLWIAEGFIECNEQFNSPEKMGEGCLSMLVERGFVVVSKKSPLGKISTCRVDGVYYEFLKKKAKEEKFFHVVNDYTSSFPDETCTHGRFSIRENIQFEGKYELKLKKPVRSLLFNALDGAEDFSFLSHLANLESLESFKCVVMCPDFASQVASHTPSLPASLTKLSLSGCGLSWDNMKVIATLPKLESLKLRWHAFRGAEWKQEGDGQDFPQLKFLLLEDLGIQWWKAGRRHFPRLTNLVIRHCYKLREIPAVIGNITTLKTIELVDCNASALRSAQEIKVARLSRGYVQVDFHSSRDD
ncbi:hypothetical protein SASPL_134834 [Salvia splendens]|uniref:Disease resistance protein winged helix domain-containing protein n=1 Tax=Salvia splendens TaxID=180675 RepID=A0A8X8ZF92_SALSN|nr:hypothetical protein SASPL_134834 [Salvia splendens]